MKSHRAYRTELDPNDVQRTAFLQHAGAARYAFNFGLRRKIDEYQRTGKSPSAIDLHRELNALKHVPKEDGGCPWAYETSKCAMQEGLRDLDKAFRNFFRRCKEGSKHKGFPKFKIRKRGIGGFRLTGSIHASERAVVLPRIGEVRLKESGYLPTDETHILSATVSERAGRWFVSVLTHETPTRPLGTEILGVDVGVKSLAVLSDGTIFENPRALSGAEDRLRSLQKSVSRKAKGSSNRRKAVAKLGRQHYRVACVRSDFIHKASDAIAKRASIVVLESLNVLGMVKNRSLARVILDASMAELHRQLAYKMEWAGGTVIKADQWFPSSKTCSACGKIAESLSLSERVFRCDCGFEVDRDLNAAINLKNLAVSSTVTACCPGGSGSHRKTRTKLLVGQEPSASEACPCLG